MSVNRNPALDGIRGIAILSVVLLHATMTIGYRWAPVSAVLRMTQAGWLGVEIFFALSGFLITGILLNSKHRPASKYFGTFYFRRALRIFPLYFGVLILLLVIPLLVSALNTADYHRFVSMQAWFWLYAENILREYHGITQPSLEFGWFEVTHFWTLAVEEHFYLVWPLLVYFLPMRWLVTASVAVIAVSVALRTGLPPIETSVGAAAVATPKYLSGLVIGGLAAMWAHVAKPEVIVRVSRVGACVLALALLAVCLNAPTAYSNIPIGPQGVILRGLVTLLVAGATAFMALIVSANPTGRSANILSWPLLLTYGKYSYGIYVFHQVLGPLIRTVNLASWPGGYEVGALCYVGLFLTVPLIVARVSYEYWEQPWLRLKEAQVDRPVQTTAVAA